MNYKSVKGLSPTMREDFETYRYDGHTALAAIMAMRLWECHDLLLNLLGDAPNAMAKALAIECPLDQENQDRFEAFVQEALPGM